MFRCFTCVYDSGPDYWNDGASSWTSDSESASSMADIEAEDIVHLNAVGRFGVAFELFVARQFARWGHFCAEFPVPVIVVSIMSCIVLAAGLLYLEVTSDPVQLWAAPGSVTRNQKEFFDETFRPFYRTNQVIIHVAENSSLPWIYNYTDSLDMIQDFTPLFTKEFLLQILDLQKQIEAIETEENGVTLQDVCNAPLSPEDNHCMVQGIWAYWQDDPEKLDDFGWNNNTNHNDTYLDHFLLCTRNPALPDDGLAVPNSCLSAGNIPYQPYYMLGGYNPDPEVWLDDPDYTKSTAVSITFLVDNWDNYSEDPYDIKRLEMAREWESAFIAFMKNFTATPEAMVNLDIAFYSERSIEDELIRESQGDVTTILISYCAMFLYITVALGRIPKSAKRLFIESKITLGISGVLLVLLSVFASIGIFGYAGWVSNLIVFEISPFLVLAIGVDNIFIIVQTYQRSTRLPSETMPEQVGRALGEVGPSMLLSSIAEATCFFLGSTSDMPAVKAFAVNAGFAILIDFLMQVSCFVSLVALDAARYEGNRVDVVCCVKVSSDSDSEDEAVLVNGGRKASSSTVSSVNSMADKYLKPQKSMTSYAEKKMKKEKRKKEKAKEGILYRAIYDYYAPVLLHSYVRPVVVIGFFFLLCAALAATPKLEVGLDQDVAMPDDSYVLKYFEFLYLYLSVGPPFYIVMNTTALQFNWTDYDMQNRVAGSAGSYDDSLQAQVKSWSKEPDTTYVATPAQSWIDDYFAWTLTESCAYYNDVTKQVCQSNYPNDESLPGECIKCPKPENGSTRPDPHQFRKQLYWFWTDSPGEDCPPAGKGAYRDAMRLKQVGVDDDGFALWDVYASDFMVFHTVLQTSEDFTEAYRWARDMCDNISSVVNRDVPPEKSVPVFPYSIFYVYYEQYLTMWNQTIAVLGISLAAILGVCVLLLGFDFPSAALIIITICMIVIDLMGMMYWWNIQLNGVSLMNLVVAIGISVEFCAHLTRHYSVSLNRDPIQRARRTLGLMGSSVLSGITITKFVGIVVLAFAESQIFEVYFFRMYLGIALIGAGHGLMFLPVALTYVGPGIKRALAIRQKVIRDYGVNALPLFFEDD